MGWLKQKNTLADWNFVANQNVSLFSYKETILAKKRWKKMRNDRWKILSLSQVRNILASWIQYDVFPLSHSVCNNVTHFSHTLLSRGPLKQISKFRFRASNVQTFPKGGRVGLQNPLGDTARVDWVYLRVTPKRVKCPLINLNLKIKLLKAYKIGATTQSFVYKSSTGLPP